MSIDVMRLVWKRSPYQGNTLLAMLALADWSNDEGVSWPSVMSVAKKSRQSERNTQLCLQKMQTDGYLEVEERDGTSSLYRIKLEALEGCKDNTPQKSARGGKRDRKEPALFAPKPSEPSDTSKEQPPETPSEPPSEGSGVVLGVPKEKRKDAVEWLWGQYIQRLERDPKRYTLTPARREKAMLRLTECLQKHKDLPETERLRAAVEDMLRAIKDLAVSEFHRERGFVDWSDHLFKSREKLETWLDNKRVNDNPIRGRPSRYVEVESESPAQVAQRQRGLI